MPKASIWAKYNPNRNPESTNFPQINHIRRTAEVLSSQHARRPRACADPPRRRPPAFLATQPPPLPSSAPVCVARYLLSPSTTLPARHLRLNKQSGATHDGAMEVTLF
jgi:hypothetical protein